MPVSVGMKFGGLAPLALHLVSAKCRVVLSSFCGPSAPGRCVTRSHVRFPDSFRFRYRQMHGPATYTKCGCRLCLASLRRTCYSRNDRGVASSMGQMTTIAAITMDRGP